MIGSLCVYFIAFPMSQGCGAPDFAYTGCTTFTCRRVTLVRAEFFNRVLT